jgi:predicted transglutaminase-like cysteine proteinase
MAGEQDETMPTPEKSTVILATGVIGEVALVMALSSFAPALGTEGFGDTAAVQSARIAFQTPTMAPLGHAKFCLHYRDDCNVRGTGIPQLTSQLWYDLNRVNHEVNRDIAPEVKSTDPVVVQWQVSPSAGDCNDYAVTKRHELLARGWPSDALLLSEVVVASGEHHLVLLVHMKNADLVLDNLVSEIQPVDSHDYRWVRAESPVDPKYWSTVSVRGT